MCTLLIIFGKFAIVIEISIQDCYHKKSWKAMNSAARLLYGYLWIIC